jgi:hypothetical protein
MLGCLQTTWHNNSKDHTLNKIFITWETWTQSIPFIKTITGVLHSLVVWHFKETTKKLLVGETDFWRQLARISGTDIIQNHTIREKIGLTKFDSG